ncbi:hydrogenase maturation protein HypF [Bradyrhizobium oligotrophicum S58]|uniref:Carbamoyltransferase HypF n=1 Tax=Bradyrhizobium oligotrophicum S58 TaxID=1245469 RepID=M4ZVJ7_9BRAD|nr:carbamoyltransferase HypF [Bradyrhizobium oligotrophicum]BAM90365.1 hydrogenase maturation protein HypF [Bradyrhizobium oligotrophicum S58]
MDASAAGTEALRPRHGVETVEIRVRGTVQGVGFRPTVWRLARDNELVGHVLNDSCGVLIRATGEQARIARFLSCLEANPPPLSRIESLDIHRLDEILTFEDFCIARSIGGDTRTNVTADAATCPACWAELLDPRERRHGYAFTNCTHCGPRMSIVTAVPYDRAHTTMAAFEMCRACAAEYRDPSDRRFHAEPIACPECGPKLWFEPLGGNMPDDESPVPALDAAVRWIRDGKILAIRGLGGFHLACDATNAGAVDRLRARKRRFGKPFALMARDTAVIRRFAAISSRELELLQSPGAPIVLLRADGPRHLPENVAPGLATLGFMLAYTPLHKLILENFDGPLVMTSGNISDEPQVTDNRDARAKLAGIADGALLHDRDIANRIDDSVVRVMSGRARLLRRARGFAPTPIALPQSLADAPDILAFGGELKSTFCLIGNGVAIPSQHQGDLEDVATFDDYNKNLALYGELYSHRARVLAVDMHPEYLSSKLARKRASGDDATVLHEIQHHHAHIASALAENGRELAAAPVLGVVLDGSGFGVDGTLWGGEFLRADYCGYQRLAAFKPVAMIGGAQAIREPWRNTYAHLVAAFGWEQFQRDFGDLNLARYLAGKPRAIIDRMLASAINVPLASSCGRLFDAAAAAAGLCPEVALFEGQAAMMFEDLIDDRARAAAESLGFYAFGCETPPETGHEILEPRPMWRALLEDLRSETPTPVISARFHLGLAISVADMAVRLARQSRAEPIDTIVLTGGCFQNKTLFEACVGRIESQGLTCLTQSQVPMNDGGLALGQAAIAAAREITMRAAA